MSIYKNRDMTVSCTKCGKDLRGVDLHAHVCRVEESEPVTYKRLHLPQRCLCKGCGEYTDVQYLHLGGETRCWDCTFKPRPEKDMALKEPVYADAELNLDSLVDGSVANLVNHDPKQVLWDLCTEFVQAYQIKSPDCLRQSKQIQLQHLLDIVADICDIVGWYEE